MELNKFNQFINKNTDKSNIEKIVKLYGRMVYNTAYYLVNEKKLACEVLDKVMLHTYEYKDGCSPEEQDVRKWIYRLTIESCIEINEKSRSEVQGNYERLEKTIHSTISMVPLDQRIVLVLRDIQNLSYEEVSEILALPMDMVAARLNEGRLKIQKHLA